MAGEPEDIDTRVSPSLHPRNVMEIDGYDDDTKDVLAPVMTAFSEAYIGIGRVHTAREQAAKNPVWNEANQIIETQNFADKVFAGVAKTMDRTHAVLVKQVAQLEGEMSQAVASKATYALATEIRAHAKAMPTGKVLSFIQEAIANGDEITATSILSAPAYLSGLTPEFKATLTRMYHEKQNPRMAKRLKACKGALELVRDRSGLVFTGIEKAVGVPPHKVQALRNAKTNAEKAFVLQST